MRFWFTASLAAFTILGGTASAQESNAARWVWNEQIANGCDSGQGTFDRSGFVETDLTGDGRADLFVSHNSLRCSSGRSTFCGIANCLFIIYVREGDLLVPKVSVSAVEPRIASGTPPIIEAATMQGGLLQWRWNGREFVQTPG